MVISISESLRTFKKCSCAKEKGMTNLFSSRMALVSVFASGVRLKDENRETCRGSDQSSLPLFCGASHHPKNQRDELDCSDQTNDPHRSAERSPIHRPPHETIFRNHDTKIPFAFCLNQNGSATIWKYPTDFLSRQSLFPS